MKRTIITLAVMLLTLLGYTQQLEQQLSPLKLAEHDTVTNIVNKGVMNNKAPVCFNCANACPACGFTTSPTVPQVTGSCPDYPFVPPLETGQTATRCASFTANNTTVSFGVIVSSNCNNGNVSNFSWTLQSNSCGGVLQSGNLGSLTFTGLTIGQSYVFCYTFTVPNAICGWWWCDCEHTTHWPYFVGATVLPIKLESFEGYKKGNSNHIKWLTSAEINNDYFTLERSKDAENWEEVTIIKGAGNSNTVNEYAFYDNTYTEGINYYRLKQTDFDGVFEYFNTIAINNLSNSKYNYTMHEDYIYFSEKHEFKLYNLMGTIIKEDNSNKLITSDLSSGIYIIKIGVYTQKIVIK